MALLTLDQLAALQATGGGGEDALEYNWDALGVPLEQQALASYMKSPGIAGQTTPDKLRELGMYYLGRPIQTSADYDEAVRLASQSIAGQPRGTQDPTGIFAVPDRDPLYDYGGAALQGVVGAGLGYGALNATGLLGGTASGLGGATAPVAELPAAGTTLEGSFIGGAPVSPEFSLGGGATGYGVSGTAAVPATTGVGGAGTGAVTGTALSRLLGLDQQSADLLSVLGTVGATGLGAYAANQQSNALENIANQARADRAPFLNAATGYLNNPQSYFEGPGKGALDATLAQLSAKFGNPIGSGAALQIATGAGLQDWRNAVTGFGNLGLAGEDTRAQLMSGAAQQDANVLSNIAGGASDLINPRRSLADLLKDYQGIRGLI